MENEKSIFEVTINSENQGATIHFENFVLLGKNAQGIFCVEYGGIEWLKLEGKDKDRYLLELAIIMQKISRFTPTKNRKMILYGLNLEEKILEEKLNEGWDTKMEQKEKACCLSASKPLSPYETTVEGMLSADYKERFKAEYQQTKIRYEKLKAFCNRIEAAMRPYHGDTKRVQMPEHDCPLDLLIDQQRAMGEYLHCLEIRAVIEGIDLQ